MTRISIVNQHTNNYGDDAAGLALLQAASDSLKVDEVDVFFIWHANDRSSAVDRYGAQEADVRSHFLRDLSGDVDRRAHLALCAAGFLLTRRLMRPEIRTLVERCKSSDFVFVSPAGSNIGIYKDWMYLLVLLTLVIAGVRPIFMQNTIGQSNSRIFNLLARFVLRRSDVSVRELSSSQWLARHKIGSYLGVDTALLLPSLPVARVRVPADYIAVVPTALGTWHRDFRGADEALLWKDALVDALAETATREKLEVRIVPHLYGAHAEASNLETLASALRDRGCDASVAAVISLDDYRRTLSEATIVVSMRYHGLILAAMTGVPCVSLAYENKMKEAAEYLGLASVAINVRSATSQVLVDCMSTALGLRDQYAASSTQRVDELRAIARGPILSAVSSTLRGSFDIRAHVSRP